MHGRCVLKILAVILLLGPHLGCEDAEPQSAQTTQAAAPELGAAFDAASTGTIQGQVLWDGPLPTVPPYQLETYRFSTKDIPADLLRANPNAPAVDPATSGVDQAVVVLRGIDVSKARPWDHAPARVELSDLRLHLFQGEQAVRTAFVRQGAEIEMAIGERRFYSLHASGAAFFTYTFVDPERARTRRLDKNGLVRLTSANGYYWMEGYLFVADHPYYARTDRQGRFCLENVPAGRYEVVCWLPNWITTRRDRDPESCLVTRIEFAPPLEQEKQVVVNQGESSTVDFTVSTSAACGLASNPR